MKKLISALVFLMIFSSCTKSLVRIKVNLMKKTYRIQYFSNGKSQIAFIGVMHINTPEYYKRVKSDIDSLRNVGYTILFEGISRDSTISAEDTEILNKKLRKITGFHLSAYLDTLNQDMKKFQVKGLVNQTVASTGLNPKIDIQADFTLDSLIAKYEADKGIIELSQCDLATRLGQKYKCGKVDKKNVAYLTMYLRDQYLLNTILRQKNNKIAILYGDRHKYNLLDNLKRNDSAWNYHRP